MFCLPLNEAEFNSDKTNLKKHFVREQIPFDKPEVWKKEAVWDDYFKEVVVPYKKIKQQFADYGFSFKENVKFQDFSDCISSYKVNIVFSHCKIGENEAIEFFDRLVTAEELVESIPLTFNGTIDLSVCSPINTAALLKDKRRMAVVKSSDKTIGFIYWLYFYAIVFKVIKQGGVKFYSNALESAIEQLNIFPKEQKMKQEPKLNLKQLLKAYIDGTIVPKIYRGGGGDQPNLPNFQKNKEDIMIIRLEKNSNFNNKLIVVIVVSLLLVLFILCYLIWKNIENVPLVLGLIGGQGASVLVVINKLRSIFKEKNYTDLMLYLMPRLETEAERTKYMEYLLKLLE